MDKKEQLLKATHQGELDLNGFKLSCAVLESGERVFSERSLALAFGIKGSGAYWEKKRNNPDSAFLPEYLSTKYIEPFVDKDLKVKLDSAKNYMSVSNKESSGIDATLLPLICDVYVRAYKAGVMQTNVSNAANVAHKLIMGFATVGVIALVDEATGYQYERESDELQKILKAYVSEELLPWQKRFPDVFYKELFRLNEWNYTVNGIKRRPSVIGTWTNMLVYDELPKGVKDELKSKTPKSKKGNYTVRLHQSLTEDVGNSHLAEQISKIITLFQLSDNMEHMWAQFNKLRQRQAGQLELPFKFDEKGHTIEPTEESNLSDFDKNLMTALKYNPKNK